MAKLKCVKHTHRVHVLDNGHKVIHRFDGSPCNSPALVIGQATYRVRDLPLTPAEKLLHAIFSPLRDSDT